MPLFLPLLLNLPTAGQGVATPPIYETRRVHDPEGTGTFYRGREIAQFMSHEGAGWLDRPEREREEAPRKLLKALDLKPGMTVADVGAGSGYLTLPMARSVGKSGKVFAVDIQREMLDIVRAKAKRAGLTNVVPVLGTEDNPKVPPSSCDLMLLVDVYHELGRPYEMTGNMIRGLKKGGRLVLVEYRKEDPSVQIKELHKMSVAQVRKEMAFFPLRFAGVDESLPIQHVLTFVKK